MTDENLDLMIFALSTPCWDLSDKIRLEFFDMAKELKRRRNEVHEPLKELIKLRAENKKINEEYQRLEHELDTVKDARPDPCKKFCDASKKEWVAKLNEEAGEVIEALYNPTVSREDCLREMVDVATVARSMAYATGYTLDEWEEMQRWVNGNNRQRGYMDEPVR